MNWRYIKTPFIAWKFTRGVWARNGKHPTWAEAWHIALGLVDAEVIKASR